MTNPQTGKIEIYDPAEGGEWSRPPVFPDGAGGLVSTADDYLSFAQMLLDKGRHGKTRILSRPSVELMTADQLTPEQRATSGFGPDFFADSGWGFGLRVVTRCTGPGSVGSYGWSGGIGTFWESNPSEDMIAILMTQKGLGVAARCVRRFPFSRVRRHRRLISRRRPLRVSRAPRWPAAACRPGLASRASPASGVPRTSATPASRPRGFRELRRRVRERGGQPRHLDYVAAPVLGRCLIPASSSLIISPIRSARLAGLRLVASIQLR